MGSGAVESANRHAAGARLKQAGMRWLDYSIKGVLALRAQLRSQRWNQWWDQQLLPILLAAWRKPGTPSSPGKTPWQIFLDSKRLALEKDLG